jgi:hypothetical protein
VLLEQTYRKELDDLRARVPGDLHRRSEVLLDLGAFLFRHERKSEAEPLFRELLECRRNQVPRAPDYIVCALIELLHLVVSLAESDRQSGDLTRATSRTSEAEELTSEILKTLSEQSLARPQDTGFTMRVAALEAWFGKSDASSKTCRRLIDAAEKAPDDVTSAERAAKAYCIRPVADPALLKRALQLARRGCELSKRIRNAHGRS